MLLPLLLIVAALGAEPTPEDRVLAGGKAAKQLTAAEKLYYQAVLDAQPLKRVAPRRWQVGTVGVFDWSFEVRQVLDDDSALIAGDGIDFLLWIPGGTSKLADGRWTNVKTRVCAIGRTHTYRTVLGAARTVPVLEVVDNERTRLAIEGAMIDAARHEFAGRGELYFVELKAGNVRAMKGDGTRVEFPSSELAREDAEWIRAHVARTKKQLAAMLPPLK